VNDDRVWHNHEGRGRGWWSPPRGRQLSRLRGVAGRHKAPYNEAKQGGCEQRPDGAALRDAARRGATGVCRRALALALGWFK
jgi:hypothetical protein